ncbi:MAG: prepilin-type N-terminal cleavage/methylation domain-containing protein [Butyrivibrio sp.]
MKKFFKRFKKNKGFSLVEVLVAMAVLAAISIPLIQNFVFSANVNKKAKRLQNATDVGQDVAEYFGSVRLLDLIAKYKDNGDLRGGYLKDDDTGIIVFQNIGSGEKDSDGVPYYEGADGEDFYVTVVLNPNDYADSSSPLAIKDINKYTSPELGDLFSIDTVTVFSQFTKYDARIKTALRNKYPGVSELEAMDYDDIKKTVELSIEQEQNPSNNRKIDYCYSMVVKYTYCTKSGNDYVETPYSIEYTFVLAENTVDASGIIPDLYLLYTPFDTNDSTHTGMAARDEIIINYRKDSVAAAWEKGINIYLVQQDGGTYCSGLDKQKIFMNAYNEPTALAYDRYPSINKLDMYSNVAGWQKNVTSGTSSMIKLYTLDVYIWYREKDPNAIDAYLADGFKDGSNYTVVSTIKEE